jgi:hypothetical protein
MKIHQSKNMRAALLSLFLVAFSSHSFAQWTALNTSNTFFYDPNTFTSEGKYAKVWGIVNYVDPIPNGYPKSKKIYLESDCHQGQVKTLLFTFTSEPMGKGDVLAESNQSYSPWRYVQPDTIDAALFKVSCRSKISAQGPDNADVTGDPDTLDEDEEVLDEAAANQ